MSEPPIPGRSFLKNLQSLATDPSTADFTISCSGQDFKVSRIMVRLHSGYFANLFNSDWPAHKDNRIDLQEDEPATIQAMIDYFLHFAYGTYTCKHGYVPAEAGKTTKSSRKGDDLEGAVHFHAKVWVIADKYDVPDLKLLACENFERDCPHLLSSDAMNLGPSPANKVLWFTIVEYIYENSNPTEQGLRASIVKSWAGSSKHSSERVEREKWHVLMDKFPALGVDMAMALAVVDRGPAGAHGTGGYARPAVLSDDASGLRRYVGLGEDFAPSQRPDIFRKQRDLARAKYASSDEDGE